MTLSFLVFSLRLSRRIGYNRTRCCCSKRVSPDFFFRLLHRRPILLKEGSTNSNQVSSNPLSGTRVALAGSCLVGIGFKDGETVCFMTATRKNEGVMCSTMLATKVPGRRRARASRVNSSLRAAKNFNTNPLGMGPKNPLPVLAHAHIHMVATSKSSPTRRTVVSTRLPRENVPPTSRTSKGRARESKPSPL